MFARFAGFEIRYQLFSPMFAVVALVFFAVTFLLTSVPETSTMLAPSANINSPYMTAMIAVSISFYAVFIPTAFLSGAVLRDRHFGTEELFYTRPVREFDYLAGRFAGAFAVCLLAFAVVPLAMFLASQMPWLDADRLGPVRPLDYLYAFFVIGAPNLLIPGALMFTVANLSRSTLATYTALLVFLALYFVSSTVLTEMGQRTIGAMADPWGASALTEVTRYWTAAEVNTQLPPLTGIFLWNRLLWLGVAAALLVFNLSVFSFRARGWRLPWRRARPTAAPVLAGDIALPRVQPRFGPVTAWRQFVARLRHECGLMLRSVAFWVLMAMGALLVAVMLFNLGLLYGTPVLPVTRVVAQMASSIFAMIPLIVLIYYSSELVWRDRILRTHEILDATPAPGWVFVLPKLVAMWLTVAGLFCVAILTGVIAQLVLDSPEIDLGLYLSQMLVMTGYQFYLMATLAVFFQVLANNRWIGMLLMIGFLVVRAIAGNLGFAHNLYMFGGASGAPYSDLNLYGHFLIGRFWFNLYWTLFAAILIALTFALWERGTLTSLWRRLARLPRRLGARGAASLTVLTLAFAATGSFIFYNTNVLNPHFTGPQLRQIGVTYEQRYRQFEDAPQPRLTAVDLEVDIYPRERRFEARGVYRLENRSDTPIERLYLDYDYGLDVLEQNLEGGSVTEADDDYGFYTLAFDQPLEPGETRTLRFTVERDWQGFANGGNGSFVLWNGTFFNNMQSMPRIGFNRGKMMQNDGQRRRRGLEPLERMAAVEDEAAARHNYISPHADWLDFAAVVSTSADQIAIAPGTLQREWEENGRRYFHYRMETPILNFYAFLSARYEVMEERRDGVLLQVFYHRDHDYNVPRMLQTMGDAIAYFSGAFSPFQHSQMRIFEFPGNFGQFAQAFPNSVPYSESAGFIMDNRDPDRIDYVYYITAHEVAHQWWAHQLVGGAVQGATMLSETFAQYSALMLMEKEFGEHQIRRFLKYELDQYLTGRAMEARAELPLYRNENQPFIHYNKGSLAMYALKDYLGEETVNRVLSRFLAEYAYRSDPYPRSTDFLRILREEAGPEHETLIADLFENIVLFDLKATELSVAERDDGRFDVRLTVEAKRLEAEGDGSETEAWVDYMIDIGLFTQHPNDATEGDSHVLLLEKRAVTGGENVFEFTLDSAPEYGGIDPYNKLIDRVSDDNIISIRGETQQQFQISVPQQRS